MRQSAKPENEKQSVSILDFTEIYNALPKTTIDIIRRGVPARELKELIKKIDVPERLILLPLKLSSTNVNRKARSGDKLSSMDSERVIGFVRMVGQVQTLVEESGNSEGFNAANWLAQWLSDPLPALDGERPADYLDTIEGQRMVSNILSTMQSGAYC